MRKLYAKKTEPFFIFSDGSPVTPEHVRTIFKRMLEINDYNINLFTLQGFRAGCVTDLLKAGISVKMIKKLGRWRSNCVYTYLR